MRTRSDITVRFVVAKTQVAPLQTQTIPRLELLSALLLSHLITTVSESLESTHPQLKPKCFANFQVVLFWIHGIDKEWKPFVRNRVDEIRRLVPASCWSHCPGKDNPADIPSRGLTPLELSVNQLWRNGPEWLKTNIAFQEKQELFVMPEECATELRAKSQTAHNLLIAETLSKLGEIMRCEDYNTLSRLLRVTTYLLRAVKVFKNAISNPTSDHTVFSRLSRPSCSWLITKTSGIRQKQFGLFMNEKGLWRCGGRLTNADLPYATKHPILLPQNHPLIAMIARDAHQRVLHIGIKETPTEVRTKYWIIRSRSLLRSIIHHCVLCRRSMPCSSTTTLANL